MDEPRADEGGGWWQALRASARQAASELLDPAVLAAASDAAKDLGEMASRKASVLGTLVLDKAQAARELASENLPGLEELAREKVHQAQDLALRAGELASSVGGVALESAQGLVDELAKPDSRAALAGRLRDMLLTTDDADDGLLAAAAGVTPDLRRFLFALDEPSFLHAARTVHSDSRSEGRLPWEEDHIAAVLAHVMPLRNLHSSLVPEQLSEHLFWDTYFQLCKGLLGEREGHTTAEQQGANPMLTPPSMQNAEAGSPRSRDTQDAEEVRLHALGVPSAPQEAPVPPAVVEAAVSGGDAPGSPPPPTSEDVEQYLAGELGSSDADDETLEHEDLEALLASGGSSASLKSVSDG